MGSDQQSDDYEFYNARATRQDKGGRMFLNIGALLGLGGVVYMARGFKNKDPNMKTSVYLIHTRLLAQGTVIGEEKNLSSLIKRICVVQVFSLLVCCISIFDPHKALGSGYSDRCSHSWYVASDVHKNV